MTSTVRRILLVSFAIICFCLPLAAQRTSVGRDFPIYINGAPDLVVDPQRLVSQMEIVDRYFGPDDCALAEGVVGGTGYRRLLRFDTVIMNRGDKDLVVGDRSDPSNPYAKWFVFHSCHGHYHIKNFSIYELFNLDRITPVAQGTKQGFCFEDSFKYEGNKSNGYDCEYQGITSGWGDWYYKQLVGQWIDITGVPEGDYIVRVTINKGDDSGPIFQEGENRYPNVVEVQIHVPNPRNKVDIVP
jgi:lysyl oxidase